MTEQESDLPVLKHIERLVEEEHALYGQGKLSDGDTSGSEPSRWSSINVGISCASGAGREFGGDPDAARVRPPEIGENYEQ